MLSVSEVRQRLEQRHGELSALAQKVRLSFADVKATIADQPSNDPDGWYDMQLRLNQVEYRLSFAEQRLAATAQAIATINSTNSQPRQQVREQLDKIEKVLCESLHLCSELKRRSYRLPEHISALQKGIPALRAYLKLRKKYTRDTELELNNLSSRLREQKELMGRDDADFPTISNTLIALGSRYRRLYEICKG